MNGWMDPTSGLGRGRGKAPPGYPMKKVDGAGAMRLRFHPVYRLVPCYASPLIYGPFSDSYSTAVFMSIVCLLSLSLAMYDATFYL